MGILRLPEPVLHPQLTDCGVASRPRPGEARSGDLSSVQLTSDAVLLAVVDGLGHGYSAEVAARVAVAALAPWRGRSLSQLIADCHAALKDTRGAAIALAAIDALEATITWLAVGNIEGRLLHRSADGRNDRQYLAIHCGIVGQHIPTLRPTTLKIFAGDLVVLATDGIDGQLDRELRFDLPPKQMTGRILARCGKLSDDALVLAVRYLGGAS